MRTRTTNLISFLLLLSCSIKALTHLGLHSRFRKWIKGLTSSSKLSVLINGESTGFFGMSRGVKQGDSLSSFLFNIGMDILSFILCEIRAAGHISGFCVDENSRRGEVTHLLYADDAILFCEANEDEVRNILAALVCFQAITGLQINLEKSKLFPVGEVANLDRLAEVFGCDWAFLPTTYLGVPLGSQSPSVGQWNSLVRRTQSKLEGWKGNYLSIGGRVVLINAVLASQSTYVSSLFLIPKHIIKSLEKVQRDFLWSGNQDKEKFHLASWELCKTAKDRGGLGIRDLEVHNKALLLKWHWKFATERGSWWRNIINIKFPNPSSEWFSGTIQGRSGGSPWANIMKLKDEFWKIAFIDQGSGNRTSFWFDTWIVGSCLAEKYPRVFAAAESPSSTIADYLTFAEGNLRWDIPLIYNLRGGAERERERFFNQLEAITSVNFNAGPERPNWSAVSSGRFSVSSATKHLAAVRSTSSDHFPAKMVWQNLIPSKICIFLWLVYHNRLLTLDNLKKRGYHLPNRCSLCKKQEESANHMFVFCEFSRQVWNRLKHFIKIEDSMDETLGITERISRWPTAKPASPTHWCSIVALHAFCWTVWLERNARVFKGESCPDWLLVLKIGDAVAAWLIAAKKVDSEVAKNWTRELRARVVPIRHNPPPSASR
ncbi:unnamed protein product [Linum trigynum]|uniref:Reverse transcriptase domain-containing protein n=1 Tax=Linum trigynum TaxID=586398 RepID=A0AAV2CLI0_9ROSI